MTFLEVFEQSFIPLQRVYGVTLARDVLGIYARVLQKLSPEQLAKACINVTENFKPTAAVSFPAPAHFMDYAKGNAEERATMAVSRVMGAARKVGPNTSVSFDDKALHRTIERFGGWEEMRDFEWQFREANFRKVYIAEVNAGDNFGPDYLEGCYEKQNRLTQHNWTRGTAIPLMVTHVGDRGEPVKQLAPPKQDIPKQVESGEKVVGEILRNLGIANG